MPVQVPGAETPLVLWEQARHEPGKLPAPVFVGDRVQSTCEEPAEKGVEFTHLSKKESGASTRPSRIPKET